jgi:methionyl-tRNA formyltransferase
MRIIVLSGSPLALPALEHLFSYKYLSALICPEESIATEVAPLQNWASRKEVPCWQANQQTLEKDVTELIRETNPDLILVFGFPYSLPHQLLQDVKFGGWNVHFSLQQQNKGTITIHQLVQDKSEQVLQQLSLFLLPESQYGTALHQLSHLSVTLLNASLVKMGLEPKTKSGKHNSWAIA